MLIISLIFVLLLIFQTFSYSFKIKDFSNPIFLFIVPLCVQFMVYYFFYRKIYPIGNKTIIVWWMGIIGFVLGYIFYKLIYNKDNSIPKMKETHFKTNYIFVWFCLILGVISIFFTKSYMSGLSGQVQIFDNDALNIRDAYVNNAATIPIYVIYGKYLLLFSYLVILYDSLFKYKKINRRYVFLLGILVVYNSSLTYARIDLLLTLLSIFLIFYKYVLSFKYPKNTNLEKKYYEYYKKSKKSLVILLVIIIILFIIITRTRSYSNTSIFDSQNQILQYLGRPIQAFDYWVVNNPMTSNNWAIIEPLFKILSVLGLKLNVGPSLAPIGQFNAYSYLRVPYLQFGTIGVLIAMILVGFIANIFYSKFKNGNKYWVIFYSVYAFSLVIAFFHWQFTSTIYLYLIIYLIIVSCINTVLKKKEK